eukprot:jgi/Ulvmu1/1699/UM116_0012.1
MSITVTRNHQFLGLCDELAAQHFPDKDGPLDIQSECSVKLLTRGSMSSTSDSGCEEIFMCRNRLVWSCHGRERMRVESFKYIADAVLCAMVEDDASVNVLCVAEATTLSIYGTEGDIHQHTLQRPVKRLWPTPAGLIVECGNVVASDGFFLIQNSITGLEEVKTVTNDPLAPYCGWGGGRVLFLSPESPLAVIMRPATSASGQVIQIWCLKAFPEGALLGKQNISTSIKGTSALDAHACTPARSSRSRVRTPDDHIDPSIFSQFLSHVPGTGSTIGAGKVYLPSVSVQLAFDLSYTDEMENGTAEDACLVHGPDAASMFAVRTSHGNVMFYSCDMNGAVLKRPEVLQDVCCIAALEIAGRASVEPGQNQPCLGLLTLERGGRLWLHKGTDRLLQITVPLETLITREQVQYFPPARPTTVRASCACPDSQSMFSAKCSAKKTQGITMRDLGEAVDVSHVFGKTFLLHFSGGENIQLHVDVESHTELVRKCMHALQAVMPPPQHRELLQQYYREALLVGDDDADWKHFSTFMLRFWRAQLSAEPFLSDSCTRAALVEPVDPWQALMALGDTQAMLNSRLYPAFVSLTTPSPQHFSHDSEMQVQPVATLSGGRRNSFADSLGALHSIFEDLTLDMTLWRHLPKLAALLASLAHMLGEPDWKAYYNKHLQAAARLDLLPDASYVPVLARLNPAMPAPASMQAALHNLVAEGPISSSHAAELPLLVKRHASVVKRSIDLLRIFRVLKHTVEELSELMVENKDVAAVHRHGSLEILNLLGDLDWQLMDIDCLPFGIALPIHGAIQVLRRDPPSGVHTLNCD